MTILQRKIQIDEIFVTYYKEGLAQHTDSARVYGELVCQEGLTDQYAILVRKSLWFTKLTFKFH